MASSPAVESGAAGSPPADRLAVFYKLVDKKVIAGVLSRHARAVELAATAATHAEALFPDDSLVVARLRMDGSENLNSIAVRASDAEREAFGRQSWALLLSTIAILVRRLESNTLLPGTIRQVELDYALHDKAAIKKVLNKPVPPPSVRYAFASTMGYGTLLDAIYRSLDLLPCPWVAATQKKSVESFVLQALDLIPRTAGIRHPIAGENDVVAMVERCMTPRLYDPAFCAAVLHKWRSEAVSRVLRARGVLQTGFATAEQEKNETML